MRSYRWTIKKMRTGSWAVAMRRTDDSGRPGWNKTQPTFEAAIRYFIQARSRAIIAATLEEARVTGDEDPGACESILMTDVVVERTYGGKPSKRGAMTGSDLLEARRKILYDNGRSRGLRVRTEVDDAADPERIFIWARPDPTLVKMPYRAAATGNHINRYMSTRRAQR